jgi:hypothetical protein
MAYLSRFFAQGRKPDALASGGPSALTADAPVGAAPGPTAAPTAPAGGVNDIRAFFAANQGAGDQMLSGIADSISQRLGDAGNQARGAVRQETTTTPGGFTNGLPQGQGFGGLGYAPPSSSTHNVIDQGRMDAAQGAYDSAAGDARALIGGDTSGLSALLPQGGSRMGRNLDAWLMQGAMGRGDTASRLQGSMDNAQNAIRDTLDPPTTRAFVDVPAGTTDPAEEARRRQGNPRGGGGAPYTGRGGR